ncbi:chondroitin proteoglycan-2-like [Neocloeon triangulifer]|uniref:chondroitin proteoglycan-2-like n=1 Tax=Neocloeon triangulifer TaxID=2078957 RepID=UPI00286EF70F|nr:chondroitin proteoglycan-2-like [Neocloeon triangulifer]
MAKSTQQVSVLGLVLLALLAASPVLAARRNVRRNQQRVAGASLPKEVRRQWQMAVNVPPAFLLKQDASELPPAAPGHMWVQVPITETPPPSEAPFTTTEATESAAAAAEGSTEATPVSDPEMLKNCKEPRGQFAHPDQCNKFYNCWDGFVAEQSCPGELVFSDQGAFCDYRDNVDCSSRGGDPPAQTEAPAQTGESSSESEAPVESTEAPSGPAEGEEESEGNKVSEEQLKEDIGEGCKSPFARYRSPKNCDIFIVCSHGTPYRFECPETLNYNENLAVCDYPYRVDCGNSTSKYPQGEQQPSDATPAGPAAEPEKTHEQVWRYFYQQQQQKYPLPADLSAYYGGFAHLPPVRIAPGFVRQQ